MQEKIKIENEPYKVAKSVLERIANGKCPRAPEWGVCTKTDESCFLDCVVWKNDLQHYLNKIEEVGQCQQIK